MSAGYAVRIGLSRGWLEFRAGLTNMQDLSFYIVMPLVLLWVLWGLRNDGVDGTVLPLATLALPGVMGMMTAYSAMIGVGWSLSAEREDGTLLRAKAVPNGMVGYVSGGVLRVWLETVFTVLLVLVPALFFVRGLDMGGISGWLTLIWVFVLGMLATLPLGMIIGSLMRSPRAVGGWGFIVTGSLVAVSGIFYPITALAGWLQVIGQIFPIYWLGLGMRSAFLGDEAAAVEIAQSWRRLETIAVLGGWAIIGLLVAPIVLRRMARRESGFSVAQRREKALQRI
jgi:ABC-2 type transport system permease protein